MVIVGINAYHGDASAAILIDGKVAAAVEEERLKRIKHWAGFPQASIRCCLDIAGVTADQVDAWAVNSDSHAHRYRKFRYLLSGKGRWRLGLNRIRNRTKRQDMPSEISQLFNLKANALNFYQLEHHLCHLASAYYPSGFREALVVSIDGFGDFSSASWGYGQEGRISQKGYVHFPHSLGIFYQAITQFLGFKNYGDEYKVMGLAPYGKPSLMDQMDQVFDVDSEGKYKLNLDYFRHHNEPISFSWGGKAPEFTNLYSESLQGLLGTERKPGDPITQTHKDIAASAQRLYEKHFFRMLNKLSSETGVRNLALAGGCAMNSVANGRIRMHTPFQNIYIQPAAGDAGGAMGAAYIAHQRMDGEVPARSMTHAYLGPKFGSEEIGEAIDAAQPALQKQRCSAALLGMSDCVEQTVVALTEGKVVGWFQGAMEWGPRALGNRSILGDPRRKDMKEILNVKIKRRESFRPFAPSILRSEVGNWFEVDDDVPFMQKVYQIREDRRSQVPAVTHVDGSGRLQTVTEQHNPLYHQLITRFFSSTGVPMLLNTSFNENEPIVCYPSQALDCFLRTNMDVLVMGEYLLTRRS